MSPRFESIDSAHEYVGLLLEAIIETAADIDGFRQTSDRESPHRCEAFRLIAYKLEQLRTHVDASYHRLSELRNLHQMLERDHEAA